QIRVAFRTAYRSRTDARATVRVMPCRCSAVRDQREPSRHRAQAVSYSLLERDGGRGRMGLCGGWRASPDDALHDDSPSAATIVIAATNGPVPAAAPVTVTARRHGTPVCHPPGVRH